ncbi:MAG TPA: N-acetyltransferase [Candidatus Bathyarchaeota archaeon]|nr:N-acetyltransferase [Candidatus Bathyarchaeota archaeon]
MDMNKKGYDVIHDSSKRRFFIRLHDEEAVVRYLIEGDRLLITSTYTPPEHRGKGIAAQLLENIVEYARREGYRIVPICSYAVYFFQKRSEYRDVLADVR